MFGRFRIRVEGSKKFGQLALMQFRLAKLSGLKRTDR